MHFPDIFLKKYILYWKNVKLKTLYQATGNFFYFFRSSKPAQIFKMLKKMLPQALFLTCDKKTSFLHLRMRRRLRTRRGRGCWSCSWRWRWMPPGSTPGSPLTHPTQTCHTLGLYYSVSKGMYLLHVDRRRSDIKIPSSKTLIMLSVYCLRLMQGGFKNG